MMPTTKLRPVFDVLVHTPEVLVLQTNAGESLLLTATDPDTSAPTKSSSYGCFNLGLHVQDDAQKVLANRAQLLALINTYLMQQADVNSQSQIEAIYWLNQIHSNQVLRIKQTSQLALNAPNADAMVSDLSNQALAIMTADCVPIVLYDPNTKQIAAIHAGWQGLANGVIARGYAELTKTNKQQLQPNLDTIHQGQQQPVQAWMGTCISQACYEVSTAVVDKMLAGCERLGMDVDEVRQQVVDTHQQVGKAWLDLPKLAQLQLQILGAQLQKSGTSVEDYSGAYACSYANDRYYSYRRQTHLGEANTGRMAMLIMRLS
ncbi:polyphenol oxidase family protein [Psychrobacter lutiphocae]|uniref:polyphenol oxidase family protein n=1 Tax=Psychrobacter lutiphocae TaxID=540500 RepID=UPI00035EC25B|nr:polyphenol oxidase family protein [Psychrobacter lutiphocae]